jgi:hypothetical protein
LDTEDFALFRHLATKKFGSPPDDAMALALAEIAEQYASGRLALSPLAKRVPDDRLRFAYGWIGEDLFIRVHEQATDDHVTVGVAMAGAAKHWTHKKARGE